MAQILLDSTQRPWWWSERDERVSQMAALMRAQGTLSFPPPDARLGVVRNGFDPSPDVSSEVSVPIPAFDTELVGFAHARNLGFGPQRTGENLEDTMAPPAAMPPWPPAQSPSLNSPPLITSPAAKAAPQSLSLNPAAAGLAIPAIGAVGTEGGAMAAALLSPPAVALIALAAIGVGGYAAYQWWHAKSPEEQDAFLREWTPRILQSSTMASGAALTSPTIDAPPTSALPMVDPAPNLPPLPGFTPPPIAPWQEPFPSDGGYRTEPEGFAETKPTSQLDLMASGDSRKSRAQKAREERCEEQLERDYATCRDVKVQVNLGLRPKSHVARCWSSAQARYSECCVGRYIPELDIDENYGE